MGHILTLNAGSSSLKFGVFEAEKEPVELVTGLIESIGASNAHMRVKSEAGEVLVDRDLEGAEGADHAGALKAALAALETHVPGLDVVSIGHRVVHGGKDYSEPAEITPETIEVLETLVPLAPLHQPANLTGIRAALEAFPGKRQVACFDTAFHRRNTFENDAFALPRAYYDKGVRRYGFHGMSYEYIAGALKEISPELGAGRVIVAHLGNGASMCGIKDGASISSTMGFTALDGLPMGTRTGQLDPGVMLYLMQHEGLNATEISDLIYKQSGLKGLSGISNDMRTLEASDDPAAKQAISYFCARVRRELGGLAAALGGLDALVFTGGIGENSDFVRAQVCSNMEWIGIELDADRNATRGETLISTDESAVTVMVIPTNEELVIARAAAKLT